MDQGDGEVVISDIARLHRYEARVGPALAGLLTYRRADHVLVLVHTETEEGFEGRGVGSALVRTALDDARAGGLLIVPRCPFAARYIDRHPRYRDLVVGDG